MNRPPLFLGLRFGSREGGFRIWFPLFILVPFLLIVLLLLLPFLLLAALLLCAFGWGRPFLLFIPVLLGILHALPGLEIDIAGPEENIFVSIK